MQMASHTDQFQIFVSYSHRDKGWIDALRLRDDLQTAGRPARFLIDDQELKTDDRWTRWASQKIEEADAALLLVSPDYLESKAIRDHELPAIAKRWSAAAGCHRLPVVFVPIEGADPRHLCGRLQVSSEELSEHLAARSWDAPLPGKARQDEAVARAIRQRVVEVLEPEIADLERVISSKYALLWSVGKGTSCRVIRATDRRLRRDVAIKALRDPDYEPIFDASLRRAAKVSEHPNVVTIFGAWLDRRPHHCVEQYIDGESLQDLLQKNPGGLDVPFVQRVLTSIGSAVDHAHRHDFRNLDIKPSNVMIENAGKLGEAHYLCASTGDSSILKMEQGRGRLGAALLYVPPEHYPDVPPGDRPLDDAFADQYRLGLLAYEMLVGPEPLKGNLDERLADIQRHTVGAPTWPAVTETRKDCPEYLARAVATMIDPLPAHRFRSLGQALQAVGAHSPELALARESYLRILDSKDEGRGFFIAFYERFLERSPEARAKFAERRFNPTVEGKCWETQLGVVREAVLLLLAYSLLNERGTHTVLTRIARTHGPEASFGTKPLDLSKESFDDFQQVLLETVADFDPQWQHAPSKHQLLDSWAAATRDGIAYLKERMSH